MKKVSTSSRDDFIYDNILKLLSEIKLVRGGTDLAYTLRNHSKIRNYCKEKQSRLLNDLEDLYFNDDGSLNEFSINDYYVNKNSLH